MRTAISLCAVLLFGCVAKGDSQDFHIPVLIKDDVQSEAFIVEYQNAGKRTVCITPDQWPNSAGKINQASSIVWGYVENTQFNIRKFNTGYCPGCAVKVRAGEVLVGRIPFAEFEMPRRLYGKEKYLHFRPLGYF